MDSVKEIAQLIVNFRDQRDWKKFHNAKDLSLAISIESAELNELFLWKSEKDADIAKIKEELADIFIYAFLLAHKQGLDVGQIIKDKMAINALKYPVDKSRGNATKYNSL